MSTGIDRWSAGVRVVGRQFLVHPAEVEHGVDLAHQMIRRHHVVEVELVEELALPDLPAAPSSLAPADHSFSATESRFAEVLNGSFATHSGSKRTSCAKTCEVRS